MKIKIKFLNDLKDTIENLNKYFSYDNARMLFVLLRFLKFKSIEIINLSKTQLKKLSEKIK